METKVSKYNCLRCFTSNDDLIDELLVYTKNSFLQGNQRLEYKDLEDEAQVATWGKYIEESKNSGIFPTLKKYLVQFQFPIQENISQSEAYKDATLKGISTTNMHLATGLILREPDKLKLFLHSSLVGKIPVIIANNRFDFRAIVQSLTCRNEPKAMPDSMGAAMIQGLNNWDRLRNAIQYASQKAVLANKALYQDRIIVLSRIPYSNVAATAMNLPEKDWLDKSLSIRLEHECAHYFTLRNFGKMTNNMHDEFIADYMGICSVLPHFNARWFLKFIGLEKYPVLREGGRINNYLGKPPLSENAFIVLQSIVKQAAENVEKFDTKLGKPIDDMDRRGRMIALCKLNLTEMASKDGVHLLHEVYNAFQVKI